MTTTASTARPAPTHTDDTDFGFAILLGSLACIRDRAEKTGDQGTLKLAKTARETTVRLMEDLGVVTRRDGAGGGV